MIEKDIREVKQINNIDEANKLISSGWVLLETGSKVLNDEPVFLFLLGKPALLELRERAESEKEKEKNVIPFKPES